MKAFIVDDDPITLTLVAFMLSEEGVETRYALSSDSRDFYQELEDFKPNVVVLDLYLEGESGFNVAKRIRSIPKLEDVAIVAMSGSGSSKDKMKAFTEGFMEYVQKPFTKDEIVDTVRKYGFSSEILNLCKKIREREIGDYELYNKLR